MNDVVLKNARPCYGEVNEFELLIEQIGVPQ